VGLIRWDEESRVRAAVGLVGLAVFTFFYATTNPSDYMHLPAAAGLVIALYSLVLVVVPSLRAMPGTPHRALILIGSYAEVLGILLVVGRAAISG